MLHVRGRGLRICCLTCCSGCLDEDPFASQLMAGLLRGLSASSFVSCSCEDKRFVCFALWLCGGVRNRSKSLFRNLLLRVAIGFTATEEMFSIPHFQEVNMKLSRASRGGYWWQSDCTCPFRPVVN